ncbi:MAG: G5 domain-containing protein [Candidatus Moranbacteria bacterium]|jgi:uncharacterized protein YabE (DUF348 family)|nr:G5 domain-containing protein [Candidatus Moranbacteria bacterium]MDD5652319.1 G5 domain-containing protein [Candidatus Moranbacteria bacterium]MDX9855951.1 G5 domain-containing protein [Candidatus Moranbacteria bacterium]
MRYHSKYKKISASLLLISAFFFGWKIFFQEKRVLGLSVEAKEVILDDNGISQRLETNAGSIEEFFDEENISLEDGDMVYPGENMAVVPGMKIKIHRIKKMSVSADNETKEIKGFEETVEKILRENGLEFKEEDIIKPSRDSFAYNDLEIKITRVEIKEEIEEESIAFKTVEEKDDELSWRTRKVTQKGEKGIKEIKYEVAYHDGEEVSRKIIETDVTKEPVDEIVTQGTYVKLGKSHTGQASWYAYTGTMSAANPWLPMGSYVKVTNKDNGKSVIVKINDRGPFGEGRIIDLDKVAFEKIAPLGQGIANIKMEEIEN